MASYQQGGNTFMVTLSINLQENFHVMYSRKSFLRKEENHNEACSSGDKLWEYFPCPFCYMEVEVPFLCDHLQEEHCFDMKNAVCPICADNLGTDTAEHFRDQHSRLLKMRKSSSSSKPSSAAAAAGKEAHEEDSYFEEHSYCMSRLAPDSSPDPLLAQFICSVVPPVDSKPGEAEGGQASPSPDDQGLNQVVMDDAASKRDIEERLRRIEFVKQMVMTTIG